MKRAFVFILLLTATQSVICQDLVLKNYRSQSDYLDTWYPQFGVRNDPVPNGGVGWNKVNNYTNSWYNTDEELRNRVINAVQEAKFYNIDSVFISGWRSRSYNDSIRYSTSDSTFQSSPNSKHISTPANAVDVYAFLKSQGDAERWIKILKNNNLEIPLPFRDTNHIVKKGPRKNSSIGNEGDLKETAISLWLGYELRDAKRAARRFKSPSYGKHKPIKVVQPTIFDESNYYNPPNSQVQTWSWESMQKKSISNAKNERRKRNEKKYLEKETKRKERLAREKQKTQQEQERKRLAAIEHREMMKEYRRSMLRQRDEVARYKREGGNYRTPF